MKMITCSLLSRFALLGISALAITTNEVKLAQAADFSLNTFNTDFNGNFTPTGQTQSSYFDTNVSNWTNNTANTGSGGYNFIVPFTPTVAPINENLNQLATGGLGADANLSLYGNTPLAAPTGTNAKWFVAMDGAYNVSSISQVITNLTVGTTYNVSYWYAAGQQNTFGTATTNSFAVGFGTNALKQPGTANDTTANLARSTGSTNVAAAGVEPEYHTSSIISQASQAPVSAWQQDSAAFTAKSKTETLSFLAQGSPTGKPPFALLTGVTFQAKKLPEPLDYLGTFFGGCAALFLRKKLKSLTK